MTDRRGNTICEKTDRFRFDPPDWWEDPNKLRGREVQIKEVITVGNGTDPTVSLKSRDPYMQAWIRTRGKVGCHFPVSWLKLID
jgi:hypothetical protein